VGLGRPNERESLLYSCCDLVSEGGQFERPDRPHSALSVNWFEIQGNLPGAAGSFLRRVRARFLTRQEKAVAFGCGHLSPENLLEAPDDLLIGHHFCLVHKLSLPSFPCTAPYPLERPIAVQKGTRSVALGLRCVPF
jgi:hypothetical protein